MQGRSLRCEIMVPAAKDVQHGIEKRTIEIVSGDSIMIFNCVVIHGTVSAASACEAMFGICVWKFSNFDIPTL